LTVLAPRSCRFPGQRATFAEDSKYHDREASLGTAHPTTDGGVLARLSRKDGARVVLLTMTRGESGDNAIGSQLFDGLGLIRTDELLTADKYYGVDEQYFTTMIDYGFSKRLDETVEKWGRENAMRDVVRVIG
jgi:LmbE family N-acetylglucosaminyl deacetylase